jgi:hypothetical protein
MRALVALLAGAAALAPAAPAHGGRLGGAARDIPGHRVVARAAASQSNLPYNGGPVLHANRTHVIFWDPAASGMSFDPGYEQLITTFFQNVAADSHNADNVYGLTGQYTDTAGPAVYQSSWGGAVTDTDTLPPNGCVEPPSSGPGWLVCLTNSQLQTETEHVVRTDHLPTTETDLYFLVTPNGFGSCTDSSSSSCALGGSSTGYCGYHSETPDGLVLYAVIPYNAVPGHCQSDNPRPNSSTADPTISTISHEHSEAITDPVGDAWIDSSGNEDGDLCITTFGPAIGGSGQTAWNEVIGGGHYFLQEEWSNEDHSCQPRDEVDQASFTTSRLSNGAVQFAGHGRDPDGSIASYTWLFGDGATGHGRNPRHLFKRAGAYKVLLRTTDSAGNWTLYTRAISAAPARDRRHRKSRRRTKSG